jgi:hypothetical protein
VGSCGKDEILGFDGSEFGSRLQNIFKEGGVRRVAHNFLSRPPLSDQVSLQTTFTSSLVSFRMMFEAFGFTRAVPALQKTISATFGTSCFGTASPPV